MKDQIVYKAKMQLPNNAYKKVVNGKTYQFVGWSLTPNGDVKYTNKAYFDYSILKAGTITDLYAIWK